VTRNKNTIKDKEGEADRVLVLYNEAARAQGFSVCHKLTDARQTRIAKRIADIGSLEQFALALSAIPGDDFLMGRVAPRRPDERRFKLDLDFLLSTDSRFGDVLAKLIDRALNGAVAPHQPQPRGRLGR
jgi:hypothetical protein